MRNCSHKAKANAYNVFVKPILSYASPAWNPVNNQSLINELEKVQRKAARFVFSDWSWQSSPSKMIARLDWKSLEQQRKVDSITTLHDIVNGKIATPPTFLPKRARDGIKFQRVHGRVNAYRNSYIPTTVELWNNLPKETLSIENRRAFKNAVLGFYK